MELKTKLHEMRSDRWAADAQKKQKTKPKKKDKDTKNPKTNRVPADVSTQKLAAVRRFVEFFA
jgi:hypothetical protein